ncbi:trans-sialidase, partial [Trypanosoma conorhini]
EMLAADASFILGAQLLKKGEEVTDVTQPTTVVHGRDVYMLLGNYSRAEPANQVAGKAGWNLLLVKGSVSGNGDDKKIQWSETRAVGAASIGFHASLTALSGGGGSGLVLSDGTLVFPMQAIKDGESVLLAMRFTPSGDKWTLSSDVFGAGCRGPSIVEWGEDGSLLAMAPCERGSYGVYPSTPRGVAWYDAGEPISRVWGTSLNRQGGDGVQSGFITATIENKKVLLLTTPVYSGEKKGAAKGALHLWLTDNSRVHDVGAVSREADDAAASSLLYKGGAPEELILLYEKKNGDSYGLVSLSLAKQLEQIKSVVQTWKEMDAALQSCTSSAAVDTRINGVCNGPVPTEGLVGLLSSTLAGTAWVDEYRGVNATVKGGAGAATSEEWGVTFSGAGAGAEWPVGSRGQNQPYYFANNGFTLAATVMIHTVPEAEEDTPLLGVRMNDAASTVLLGVSCTQDKKWKVTVGGESRELSEEDATWEAEKTYQVALQMNTDDELSVYVDGAAIYDGEDDDEEEDGDGGIASEVAELFTPHRISHIYVGGDGAEGTKTSHHVTVSSVLLYNRALGENEITQLAGSKVTLGGPSAGNAGGELQAAPSVSTSGGVETVPEVKLEGGGGEQQTEDGKRTESLQEKSDGAADGAPVREERSPAELGGGGANASPQQPVNAPPHATRTPKVEGEQSQKGETGPAGAPAPREDVVEAPGLGVAPPSSDVKVAPAPPAGDSPLSPPREPTPRRRRGRGRGRGGAVSVIAGGGQRGRRRVNTF